MSILGNNSDVPVVNSHASSLATPVSPGPSYSSYFASIPLTLAQNSANAGRHNASAMPSTPPPDEGEYPPLTPPSFNDHSSFQPSICVECRSGYNEATIMILDRIKNNVSGSAAPLPTKEIFHLECLGTLAANISAEAFPPSTSSLSSFARSDFVDIPSHHAMRRATAEGLVKGQHLSDPTLQAQMTHLLDMAFFIHSVTNPDAAQLSTNKSIINNNNNDNSSGGKRNHQVLIHCVDGYTESAILALCIIMIHYRISLAESFVKLQTDLGRSFFVYPNDAIMMLEVENQIWRRMLVEKTERETAARWKGAVSSPTSSSIASSAVPVPASQGGAFSTLFGGSGSSVTSSSGMSSLTSSLSSSSSSFFSSLLNMSNQPAQNQQQPYSLMEGITSMPDKDEELAIQRPFVQPGHEERFEWFYHPEFEGSFPSRILPFLYLGNLAHASNPGLLKSLGIQYVLSVGEEARGLNEDTRGEEVGQLDLGEDTAMEEGQSGKMAGKGDASSRFMVKLVDDMFDNGVDSLWRHLENCVAFVDEARRANARILIHCRVGVSRSATIVIAYLMAHYNLSLVDAYLMVRARRLSVIIQPNLLFMYELLQWEQRLRGQFDPMGWPGIAREVHSLNMYYIGN
ncbi:tyrosine/serine/threonine protein phosphatase pps1 [Dissophora globulifera]|nr:tyrosine/serine/threonine protein phosphatase pps1 [Dissophora globulifera]